MWVAILTCFIFLLGYLLHYWYRKPYIDNFREKCVLITGCDSGFGRKLALDLDKLGVKVFAACYSQDGADGLRQEASSKLKVLPDFDVTQEGSVNAAKAVLEEELSPDGELWGLVNNAGITRGHIFALASLEDYKACLEVNYLGLIRTSEIFMPFIKKSKGRIVNILSGFVRIPIANEPYTGSKIALIPYNDGLRRHLKAYQVHVAAIEPGVFQTNMLNMDTIFGDMDRCWSSLPQHQKDEYGVEFIREAKTDVENVLSFFSSGNRNTLDMVTESITHGLFAKHPKSRYICGYDSNILYRIGPLLTDWISDQIVKYFSIRYTRTLSKRLQEKTKHQKYSKKH